MSNLETKPIEVVCTSGTPGPEESPGAQPTPQTEDTSQSGSAASGPRPTSATSSSTVAPVEVLAPRDVPLGGPRAMRVRRTIPQRSRSMVGAWCFADSYGPDDVAETGGMRVPPHPHIGLQTVTWLFAGRVEHRDSLGSQLIVRPGELGLMTAGRGISHSERTPAGLRTPVLHGVQLWIALPSPSRNGSPSFEHFADLPVFESEEFAVRVFLGSLQVAGQRLQSPAHTHSPILGAQIDLSPGTHLILDVDRTFEHGLLVDIGEVEFAGVPVPAGSLGYLPPGNEFVEIAVGPDGPARLLLLGGTPFAEEIVMWWNFVARTHEEIAQARAAWDEAVQSADGGRPQDGGTQYASGAAAGRFGVVEGYSDSGPLPAPVLPDVRLRPRSVPPAPAAK